jgi:serine/threonine-protein kinase
VTRRLVSISLAVLACLALNSGLATASAADFEQGIKDLTGSVLAEAKKHKKRSLGVMDFTDLAGTVGPLGQFVAEELATSLAMAGEVHVVDRSRINRLLKEQGITGLDALDPASARKIGLAAGVELLVTGSVVESGNNVRVTAKLIATSSARLIAATKATMLQPGTMAGPAPQPAPPSSERQKASPQPGQPAQPAPSSAVQEQGNQEGMVLVPAGAFLSGEGANERKVFLRSFWIDYFEVTNDDYEKVRDIDYTTERANHPVADISWRDASVYCEAVGKRLPTEQEWEKAARGTDGRRYPWGNSYEPKNVNAENRHGGSLAIGQFKDGVSPYGLFDMAGNVSEWTASEEDGAKVYRGGSWASSPQEMRTTARNKLFATFKLFDLGFRCAKDAK